MKCLEGFCIVFPIGNLGRFHGGGYAPVHVHTHTHKQSLEQTEIGRKVILTREISIGRTQRRKLTACV